MEITFEELIKKVEVNRQGYSLEVKRELDKDKGEDISKEEPQLRSQERLEVEGNVPSSYMHGYMQ